MEVTGAMMPPYLPSLLWIMDPDAGSGMPAREYTRTVVESNAPGGMVLTVPVVGGASAVKRLSPECLEISSHGDWTRIHLGAIDAAYGREPYFQHYFPDISAIIGRYPERLADLNSSLLSVIIDSLRYDAMAEELRDYKKRFPKRMQSIRGRMIKMIDPGHSILEPLFRFGPDTIFLLDL